MRHLIVLVAALGAATPLLSQEVPAEPTQPRIHVVRPGDTLWDLARRYLNDPLLWPEIFRINPDIIRDPARIYPAEQLRIPWAGEGQFAGELGEPERTIFFPRETGPTQVEHLIRAAGTADVPVLTRGDFYRAAFLAPDREVTHVGQITERIAPTVVPVELPSQISIYERVLISLAPGASVREGDRLQFFRRGRSVRHHGRVWEPTALATVAAVENGVATAVVIQLFDAPTVGDLAFLAAQFPVAPGVSPAPATGVDGRIVAFQNPHPIQVTQEIVFLDRGASSGIEAGDEFVAYRPPERNRDDFRPAVEVARLQVVRVTPQTASARIMELYHPALEPGVPVRLVSKMP